MPQIARTFSQTGFQCQCHDKPVHYSYIMQLVVDYSRG